ADATAHQGRGGADELGDGQQAVVHGPEGLDRLHREHALGVAHDRGGGGGVDVGPLGGGRTQAADVGDQHRGQRARGGGGRGGAAWEGPTAEAGATALTSSPSAASARRAPIWVSRTAGNETAAEESEAASGRSV